MEEKLKIVGGRALDGEVTVQASKNAFLPILAGCVLCDGEIELKNFCPLSDLKNMCEILKTLGITSQISGEKLYINTKDIKNADLNLELTSKLRASIFLLGPLLSRFRHAKIALPGGCKIGARPIDQFVKGFEAFGAKVIEEGDFYVCDGKNLHAGTVKLDFPSVGATESLLMCAALLDGQSKIKNAAREPEILDLQNFLNSMGAKISGAGTSEIVVEGVKKLCGGKYEVMPDRIVAGTYLLACASAHGDILVKNARACDNDALLKFLKQTACQIQIFGDKIRLKAHGRLSSIKKIETRPFPGFPTDLQPQMMALQSVSMGACELTENLFENRLSHARELCRMGSNISVTDRTAHITGVKRLFGTNVFASDLRAGAGLIIAGLCAEGETLLGGLEFVDRGYFEIEKSLSNLGAQTKRIKV